MVLNCEWSWYNSNEYYCSLTGLMSNTAYTCQVHAVCAPGDTSAASPAMSFNTLCNAAIAPTNETFDAGFSNCWSQDTADDI